ncbi:MAG: 4-hydroxy-3-methylbut-2-enyl diphosphate reductase [Bacteroidetes bacterium]|nr:4-hydroxy-3-methylbut-2-enyl diphosphate reductase [Bacteroidota bacterium]
MKITIDPYSGFCFGVVYAIQKAEEELEKSGQLYCLGDIVHNNMEVERLRKRGLEVIDHEGLKNLHDTKVLIRAHGEPPETYQIALKNNIELIDASCPVVLKLQHRVRVSYDDVIENDGQIVIYGEVGHAEVNGLVGQTNGNAIIIRSEEDLDKIDYSRPINFFSQTTKSSDGFMKMKSMIEERSEKAIQKELSKEYMISNDTICRQVSNREPQLRRFAAEYDIIVFVSGKKSSNGKALYEVCKSVNPKSYFVSNDEEIDLNWFEGAQTVGICGATSTPMWLMERASFSACERPATGLRKIKS